MHVSVIIPAYNAERFLQATVESVLAQTHSDWDLTIVDNASTDGTAALATRLAKNDSRISVLRLTENAAPSGGRNAGYRALPPCTNCDSDGVLFLDADDLLEPGALARLGDRLSSEPDLPAVYGNACFIDGNGLPSRPGELQGFTRERPRLRGARVVRNVGTPTTTFESLVIWNCITTPGMLLIRRAALENVGLFDPVCSPAEDWDMAVRLAREAPLGFMDELVLGYRRHEWNMSNQPKELAQARENVIAKARRNPRNTPQQTRIVELAFRPSARYEATASLRMALRSASAGRFVAALRDLARSARSVRRWGSGCP